MSGEQITIGEAFDLAERKDKMLHREIVSLVYDLLAMSRLLPETIRTPTGFLTFDQVGIGNELHVIVNRYKECLRAPKLKERLAEAADQEQERFDDLVERIQALRSE